MTIYTATLRGYIFGTGQEWLWFRSGGGAISGVGPGEYHAGRVIAAGQAGEAPIGADHSGSGRLTFELVHSGTSGNLATLRVNVEQAAFRLRAAFAPRSEDGFETLDVELASGVFQVRGRPMAPLVDMTEADVGIGLARVTFETLDPLWYSATVKSVTVAAGGTSGGMDTPMVTPMVTTGSGSSGDAPVTNDGTADAPWTATLTGGTIGVTTPRLILGGSTVELGNEGFIPAGSVATVDSRTRSVLLDGQPRSWVSSTSVWWEIPPGQSTFSYRAASGDGTAQLVWQDASH